MGIGERFQGVLQGVLGSFNRVSEEYEIGFRGYQKVFKGFSGMFQMGFEALRRVLGYVKEGYTGLSRDFQRI